MSEVVEAALAARAAVRQALAPFGLSEGQKGAFRAGHVTEIAPFYYGGHFFPGLNDVDIRALEAQLPYPVPEQTAATIPGPLREFLSVTNGLKLFNLSVGGAYWIISPGVGAPYGLGTFILETPTFMDKSYYCFGSIIGQSCSVASLYLSPEGKVLMVHRDVHLIGQVWDSFADFLTSEVERQLRIHDDNGHVRLGFAHFPGDADDWEEIAVAMSAKRT